MIKHRPALQVPHANASLAFYLLSTGWLVAAPLLALVPLVMMIALPLVEATALLWVGLCAYAIVLAVLLARGRRSRTLFVLTCIADVLAAVPITFCVLFFGWVIVTGGA
ncbi:hypothetical protein PK98_03160 [Croceibacterium mercuriale]|uniref:Uncharacterized protein n=1 Tax=Croceibacterium mercuriale TaxID=1572751 RepID=A0A0B2BVM1_9SPHN|nr:hypothetical protein [Croceibacterium mercuriale]KHL25663.1 hypothetical protein PK98_03160 [Croceibacterium mercuriale]